jgi:hypothetical protein
MTISEFDNLLSMLFIAYLFGCEKKWNKTLKMNKLFSSDKHMVKFLRQIKVTQLITTCVTLPKNIMQKKCVLQTQGYNLSFYFINKTYERERVKAIIGFTLKTSLGQILVKSTPKFIKFENIQELLKYLENHIISLKEESETEPYTFVSDGLDFQVTASTGSYDPSGESNFTIKCMINIGEAQKEDFCTYVGGESVTTITKTQEFMSELQSVLDDFKNLDKYLQTTE